MAMEAILTTPYSMAERSRAFQQLYADSVGYSLLAASADAVKLGINTAVIQKSIASLGFKKLDEEAAESEIGDSGRLNLLILASKENPALAGRHYLMMKPFVGRMYLMCSKWHLVLSLRVGEEQLRTTRRSFLTGSGKVFTHEQFIPYTLNLNNRRLEEILAKRPGKYLAKPSRGSMGERMQLVDIRPQRVREDLLQFLMTSEFHTMDRSQVILQQYVDSPLLVDKRKFDMRVYMLVANTRRDGDGEQKQQQPGGYFVFLHPGFVRLSTAPYDPLNPDLAVHLTNQSVQAKRASLYNRVKEATTWYPDELNAYFNKRKIGLPRDWVKETLYPKMGALLGYVAAVFKYQLDDRTCNTNTFRVLGVDLLVGQDLRLYLLEFNEYPSWGRQTTVLYSIKPNLWREVISLTSEVAIRYRRGLRIADKELVARQNFRLIYSSENPQLVRENIARYFE